jgi:hypothetical protein
VEKTSALAAKISHEFNKMPTCLKIFFPHLACISSDYMSYVRKRFFSVMIMSAGRIGKKQG